MKIDSYLFALKVLVLATVVLVQTAQAQDTIETSDLGLLVAIERSRELAEQKYEYVNRDAFNQDSQRYRAQRHEHHDEPQVYVDTTTKTFSYKPYRPNVFGVYEDRR